jgi:hypothetical protein
MCSLVALLPATVSTTRITTRRSHHTCFCCSLTCHASAHNITVVINNLYDEIDDLEDELELAAEEAYLTEAAIEDADAADAAGGTMADLEKK